MSLTKLNTAVQSIFFNMLRIMLIAILLQLYPAIVSATGLKIKVSVGADSFSSGPVYPLAGETIHLRLEPRDLQEVRWFLIVPDLTVQYQNANFPWETPPYKWRGHAKIAYTKVEIPTFRGKGQIRFIAGREKFVSPPSPTAESGFWQTSCGTFFLQAEATRNGKDLATPGIESTDSLGLSRNVFRISIRLEPGLAGWVTSFFNVPGVFGSVPRQCWNYLGADCCDLLIAALYRHRGKSMPADRNVASLVTKMKHKVRGILSSGGQSDKVLLWGKDFQPGDFMAIRYEGYKQFGHVGLLWQDADKDGKLSPSDIILHAGPWPLQAESLASESFNGEFVILNP